MLRTVDGSFAVARNEDVKVRAPFRALLAGNLLGPGNARPSLLERLALRLRRKGDIVVITSARPGRLWRAADMFITTWSTRSRVDVAVIDVDGAAGLRRAELLTDLVTRAKVPVVHLLRGADLARVASADPDRMRRLLGSGAAAVALTGYLYEALASIGGVTHVIADPVEIGAYPHRVRRFVAPHLLWVCDGAPTNGMRTAVEVLRELATSESPQTSGRTHLTVVTPASRVSGREALELADSYGLRDRVSVATPLRGATAQELFAHNDVFVSDGEVDGLTIGIAEAMAAGMCIVGADVGGAGYLVGHGVDGLLVPPGEPGGVVSAVRRLLDDPDLSERLSAAARRKSETFDWSRALPRWQDLLTRVSAGGGI